MTKLSDIIKEFELIAPKNNAEDYDNVGLLGRKIIKLKVLCCLDITQDVVEGAIEKE